MKKRPHHQTAFTSTTLRLFPALMLFCTTLPTIKAENLSFPVNGKQGVVELPAISTPLTLTLFLTDGDVTIVGNDSNTLSFTCRGADRDDKGSLLVDTETGVAQLQLRGEQTESDLSLVIPSHTSIKARIMDGDVSIENLRGDVELTTSDGNVWLENIHGSVSATSSDGDIRLKQGSHSECRSIALSSSDGDISLLLPKNFPVRLKARTIDGEITTRFPYRASSRPDAMSKAPGAHKIYDDQLVFETDPNGITTLLSSEDGDISISNF